MNESSSAFSDAAAVARYAEGPPRLVAVRGGHDQELCPRDPGGGEDARRRGVAEDHVEAPRAQLLDQLAVALDHDVGQLERVERVADRTAHTAEADDHGVAVHGARIGGRDVAVGGEDVVAIGTDFDGSEDPLITCVQILYKSFMILDAGTTSNRNGVRHTG